jgi:choline dehydrogenase
LSTRCILVLLRRAGDDRRVSALAAVTGFAVDLPVQVIFGDGVVAQLPELVAGLGSSECAVVLEPAVAGLAGITAALDVCAGSGIRVERLLAPGAEPTYSAAAEAEAWLRDVRADVLVAIGGGSTMDLAKAARLLAEQGGPLHRFVGNESLLRQPAVPLVAVPTTSGTGSEVSLDAVLIDDETHLKVGLNSPCLRPQVALVDPELTHSLPAAATAYAGIDALAQAIGGVVTTRRNPVSAALGLEACRLVGRSLEAAVRDGGDRTARGEMAAASLLAGLSMSISECAAEHSVGQAIGGLLGVPHGLTIGVVLAETLEINRPDCEDALEDVADALGVPPDDGLPPGGRAIEAIRRLLAALDFPTLADVGVRPEHVDELVRRSLEDDFVRWNPHAWTEADFRAVYADALSLRAR